MIDLILAQRFAVIVSVLAIAVTQTRDTAAEQRSGSVRSLSSIAVSGELDHIIAPAVRGQSHWENTSVVIPPTPASADLGWVILSIGCDGVVWRGDYPAFTHPVGTSPTVSQNITVVSQSLAQLVPPNIKLADPRRLGSCDNIVKRLPDGSLMLVRQAVITSSPNAVASHQKTGAEIVFVSRNAGASWEYQGVVDPFDPSFANARYGKTATQGGLDRPELFVPPRGDRVYMSIHGLGDRGGNGLIFASTAPFGKRWTLVESSLPYTAPYVMTATRDRLFVFNLQNGVPDNYDAVIRWYDLPGDGRAPIKANGPFTIASKDGFSVVKEPRPNGAAATVEEGSVSITLAGNSGGETYLRVAYPHVENGKGSKQVLRTHVVKIAGSKASLVPGGSLTISAASAEGSIVDAVAVEPEYFDIPPNVLARPVLYYWKETEKTPANGLVGDGWGKVLIRGRMARGIADWSEPFVLSRNWDNSERSWNAHRRSGDYNRGAFFYDRSNGNNRGRFGYLAQWSETPLNAGRWDSIMHTNVVTTNP